MQTDQPIFPSAIIKGQLKMNQGRDRIWLLFALILGSHFSSLDWGWGEEWRQTALLCLSSHVLILGTEVTRDLDPASAGSPVHGDLQRVSYTTSFGFLLICHLWTFPLRNALKTPSHCSSKLFKAHELSYHMLNHFSYGKIQLQAPAKRLTFIVAI